MIKLSNKIFYTVLVFAMLVVAVFPAFESRSHAQNNPNALPGGDGGYLCDVAKFQILKMLDSYPTSLISTALLHSESLTSIKPFYMGLGMSHGEQMGCLPYIIQKVDLGAAEGALGSLQCPETDENICQSLLNQYKLGAEGTGSRYDARGFAQGKVSGSLLGYLYFVQNSMDYEPVPVNMAYFFKDYLVKLPIIGETAYAQSYNDYGQTLVNAVLNMWKVFRNIAYALMSVIMLWVGFAIITRRKISAQTVVSVQYALPKIVIALIFIALSYPIGALITSFAWTLFYSAPDIVVSITGGSVASIPQSTLTWSQAMNAAQQMGTGGITTVIMLLMSAAVGAGGLFAFLGFVTVVVIGFTLFAYIKAFWIYLKMVIHTATAPLHIALYALPGNDDKLEMWFKQMFAWGAGIFGMRLILSLMEAFTVDIVFQSLIPLLQGSTIIDGVVSGSLFNVAIAPLMMIFGAATAIRIPSTIENMLIGKPSGGRR